MFCPSCRAEYIDPAVRECADCQEPLVDALPEEDHEPTPGGYVEVLSTYNPSDIAMIKSLLDGTDIPYFFAGEQFLYSQPMIQAARLAVPASKLEETRELLAPLELAYTAFGDAEEDTEEEGEEGGASEEKA